MTKTIITQFDFLCVYVRSLFPYNHVKKKKKKIVQVAEKSSNHKSGAQKKNPPTNTACITIACVRVYTHHLERMRLSRQALRARASEQQIVPCEH
jgi:hypothetical protein